MGHPRIAQYVVSHRRHALGRGGTRIDPMMSLRKVYTPAGFVIDSDLYDTLKYE
jgi:hypothetical protein